MRQPYHFDLKCQHNLASGYNDGKPTSLIPCSTMSEHPSPRHIRIFLSSPGDVADERSLALKLEDSTFLLEP